MWLDHPNPSDRHTLSEQIHPSHSSPNTPQIRPNGGGAIRSTPPQPRTTEDLDTKGTNDRDLGSNGTPLPLRLAASSHQLRLRSSLRLDYDSRCGSCFRRSSILTCQPRAGTVRIASDRFQLKQQQEQEVGLHANVRTSDRTRGRDAREHVPRETKDMANVTSALAMPRVKTGRMVHERSRFHRTAGLVQRPAGKLQAKVANRSSFGRGWSDRASLKPCKPAVVASASTPAVSAASTTPPTTWKGADLKKLAACVLTAAVVWVIPPPAGITKQAWHLLAIFLGTIGKKPCDVAAPS